MWEPGSGWGTKREVVRLGAQLLESQAGQHACALMWRVQVPVNIQRSSCRASAAKNSSIVVVVSCPATSAGHMMLVAAARDNGSDTREHSARQVSAHPAVSVRATGRRYFAPEPTFQRYVPIHSWAQRYAPIHTCAHGAPMLKHFFYQVHTPLSHPTSHLGCQT